MEARLRLCPWQSIWTARGCNSMVPRFHPAQGTSNSFTVVGRYRRLWRGDRRGWVSRPRSSCWLGSHVDEGPRGARHVGDGYSDVYSFPFGLPLSGYLKPLKWVVGSLRKALFPTFYQYLNRTELIVFCKIFENPRCHSVLSLLEELCSKYLGKCQNSGNFIPW